MRTDLNNLGVVVTRPAPQARALSDLIRAAGGHAIEFPVLEIVPLPHSPELLQKLHNLHAANWAIFISINAVHFGLRLIKAAAMDMHGIKIASIGSATSTALLQNKCQIDLTSPTPASSESLLSTPEMNAVKKQRIAIFRGMGGRELLGRTLNDRGALVEYFECYERRLPQSDADILERAHADDNLDLILTTSVEGLKNLMQLLVNGACRHLLNARLLVIGGRQALEAKRAGWQGEVIVAEDATDAAIMGKLAALAENLKSTGDAGAIEVQ